jgi:hypothetical protein
MRMAACTTNNLCVGQELGYDVLSLLLKSNMHTVWSSPSLNPSYRTNKSTMLFCQYA